MEACNSDKATLCEVTRVVLTGVVEPYAVVVPYSTCELEGSSVVQMTVAPDEVTELADTLEITGSCTCVTLTVTGMLAVAVRFAVSVAIALSVCDPLLTDVVFHEVEKVGPGPVTELPILAPST